MQSALLAEYHTGSDEMNYFKHKKDADLKDKKRAKNANHVTIKQNNEDVTNHSLKEIEKNPKLEIEKIRKKGNILSNWAVILGKIRFILQKIWNIFSYFFYFFTWIGITVAIWVLPVIWSRA